MTARLGAVLVAGVLMPAAALFAVPGTVRAAGCESTFAEAATSQTVRPFRDADLIRSLRTTPDTGLHTASPEPSDHSHRLLVLGAHDCTTAH